MTDERNLGARAAIARLVDAKRNGDRDAINDAILSLGRVAEGVFRAKIERELRATRELSRGYSVACDESCDLLNEALWRVYQKAETFRGASDEQALAWLSRIIQRITLDKRRVVARRSKKWFDIFRLVSPREKILLEARQDLER